MKHRPSPLEHLPWADELTRREELFDQITAPEHVSVTDLPPHLTVIPSIEASLAIRHDINFGITQILYSIVRAGSHGFAIARAYGKGVPARGRSYITQINEDPYHQETKMISTLFPRAEITLGGDSKIVPSLSAEGQHLTIKTNKKGEVRIQSRQHKTTGPFQLITATRLATKVEENTPLENENWTWSLPAGSLRRHLKGYSL